MIFNDSSSDEEEEHFQNICPSWIGKIYQVQYFIKVYVKHDGMFETGPGNWCNLPVKILSTPQLDPISDPWRVADNWNPWQGTEEPTYVFLQNPDEKPEYMTKFIELYWAKWEANIAPILKANEEAEKSKARLKEGAKSSRDLNEEIKEGGPQ